MRDSGGRAARVPRIEMVATRQGAPTRAPVVWAWLATALVLALPVLAAGQDSEEDVPSVPEASQAPEPEAAEPAGSDAAELGDMPESEGSVASSAADVTHEDDEDDDDASSDDDDYSSYDDDDDDYSSYDDDDDDGYDGGDDDDGERAEVVSGADVPPGAIVLGVGAGLVVLGAVTGVYVLNTVSRLDSVCPSGVCAGDLSSTRDAAGSLAIVTDVLLVGGGVVAVTGIILWAVLGGGDDAEPDDMSEPEVSFGCAPTGCSASLRGRF